MALSTRFKNFQTRRIDCYYEVRAFVRMCQDHAVIVLLSSRRIRTDLNKNGAKIILRTIKAIKIQKKVIHVQLLLRVLCFQTFLILMEWVYSYYYSLFWYMYS